MDPRFEMLERDKLYVVGFRARRLYSTIITCETGSDYSHCGAAFYFRGEWWVTHATPNPGELVAIDEQTWRKGVIMTRLTEELDSGWYNYMSFYEVQDLKLTLERSNKLFKKYFENSHKKYESDWLYLGNAVCDWSCCGNDCCKNDVKRDEFFCSEWAAHFIMDFLILTWSSQSTRPRM